MKHTKRLLALLTIFTLLFSSVAYAHSGRTDSAGGHRDNRNVSGLGYYHYHCGGNPPHLHTGGVCPYNRSVSYSKPQTAKPQTAKPQTTTAKPQTTAAKPATPNGKRSVHQSGCQWFRHHRPCPLVQEQLLCACESACRQTFRSGWPCQRQTGTACDSAETAACGTDCTGQQKLLYGCLCDFHSLQCQRQSLSQNGLLYCQTEWSFRLSCHG